MKFYIQVALVIAVCTANGCATTEQQKVASAAPAQAEAGGEVAEGENTGEEKLVCKYVKTTGTRFGQKICGTPKEWDEKRKASKEMADEMQRTPTGTTQY